MNLRSPCANCKRYNIPTCLPKCVRIKCFQLRLMKANISSFGVTGTEDTYKITIITGD